MVLINGSFLLDRKSKMLIKVVQLLFERCKADGFEVDAIDSDFTLAKHFTQDISFLDDEDFLESLEILNYDKVLP